MTNQDKITSAMDAVLLSINNIQSRVKDNTNKVWICMNNSYVFEVLKNSLALKNIVFKPITYMAENPFTIELECEDIASLIKRYISRGIPCTA